ncbi:MAG: FGGY family carbohydrate kinase [Hyphomicrobiaceae bacterium]
MTVLAIDQGTTSTKAFLLRDDGRLDPVGAIRHRQIHGGEGLVEHDADELIGNIETLIGEALAKEPGIAGIAIDNQGETVVAFDRDSGRPLHNAIVWQDQRTQAWLDALAPEARERITAICGLPVDAYFSAGKLAWLLENVDGVRALARTSRLGLATSDAFFLARLTGRYATDITTASRTSLMDLAAGRWSDELADLFGVPVDLLPSIVPTTGPIGEARIAGRSIPVTASVVDQQAALFGHGCRRAGDLKITFGTGTFALALTGETPVSDRAGLVPTIAWQLAGARPVYALDGGDYTAAAAVEWASSVGLAGGLADFEMPAGPSALVRGHVFVPALAGLAAPHWDRAAGGAFLGLRQSTSAADMRRAVLEGVALRAVELVEMLGGAPETAISIDGGLTNNGYFVQFLADALGRPVVMRGHGELTALGAAELGYLGLGRPVPPRDRGQDREIPPSAASEAIRAARPVFARAIAAVKMAAGG